MLFIILKQYLTIHFQKYIKSNGLKQFIYGCYGFRGFMIFNGSNNLRYKLLQRHLHFQNLDIIGFKLYQKIASPRFTRATKFKNHQFYT